LVETVAARTGTGLGRDHHSQRGCLVRHRPVSTGRQQGDALGQGAHVGVVDGGVDADPAGGDVALRNPVENAEDDEERGWIELQERHVNEKDTVIGIAASGTTPYVLGALRNARAHGILTASISSNPDSPISKEAEIPIEMILGPEFVTGSSRMKSGTGQKMILNMITTTTMIKLGRVKGNRMVNMQLSNQKLVDRGTRMVMEELNLEYDQSQRLLLMYGSVKNAVDAYRENNKG
jgi:N-acetylmuramic acid 6-phosphate etherase